MQGPACCYFCCLFSTHTSDLLVHHQCVTGSLWGCLQAWVQFAEACVGYSYLHKESAAFHLTWAASPIWTHVTGLKASRAEAQGVAASPGHSSGRCVADNHHPKARSPTPSVLLVASGSLMGATAPSADLCSSPHPSVTQQKPLHASSVSITGQAAPWYLQPLQRPTLCSTSPKTTLSPFSLLTQLRAVTPTAAPTPSYNPTQCTPVSRHCCWHMWGALLLHTSAVISAELQGERWAQGSAHGADAVPTLVVQHSSSVLFKLSVLPSLLSHPSCSAPAPYMPMQGEKTDTDFPKPPASCGTRTQGSASSCPSRLARQLQPLPQRWGKQ